MNYLEYTNKSLSINLLLVTYFSVPYLVFYYVSSIILSI